MQKVKLLTLIAIAALLIGPSKARDEFNQSTRNPRITCDSVQEVILKIGITLHWPPVRAYNDQWLKATILEFSDPEAGQLVQIIFTQLKITKTDYEFVRECYNGDDKLSIYVARVTPI